MGTKRNYSLTKDKYRFNDDFMTEIIGKSGISGKKLDSLHYFPEISHLNDFSISYFVVLNSTNTNIVLDTRQQNLSDKGCFTRISTTKFTFGRGRDFGGPLQKEILVTFDFPLNSLIHIVLTYNSTLQTFNLFYNSRKIGFDIPFPHTIESNLLNNSAFGRFSPENLTQGNFMLRDLATFNKQLNQTEINYIYQAGVLPTTTHESCRFHTSFNGVANKYENKRVRKVLDTNGLYDAILLFNVTLNIGDEFTCVCTANPESARFFWGLTDATTPATIGIVKYIFWTNNGSLFNSPGGTSAGAINYGDEYKIKIEDATNIGYYVNNILITTKTYTATGLSGYRVYVQLEDSNQSLLYNLKKNGVSLHKDGNVEESLTIGYTINDNVSMNVVSNYNYAKTVPIVEADIHHLGFSGFDDHEIGISNPSRLGAFKDFYTKGNYYGVGLEYSDDSSLLYRGAIANINGGNVLESVTYVFKVDSRLFEGSVRGDISRSGNYYFYAQSNGIFGQFNGVTLQIGLIKNKPTSMCVKIDFSINQVTCFQDGEFKLTYNTPITQGSDWIDMGANGVSRKLKALYYLGAFSGLLTNQEAREGTISDDWTNKSLNPLVFYGSENNGTHYIDHSGNGIDLPMQDPAYFQANQKYADVTGKSIIKYGLNFNGTNQYLEVQNIPQFDTNKGITILCGFADIDETATQKDILHLTDSTIQKEVTLAYDDNTSNVIFKSGDVSQDTQSIGIDKTGSNFGVYRISDDKNKYNDGLFKKSSSINTVDTTRTNQSLGRTDATYNVFIGSNNGGSTPIDAVITYCVIYEGILNDAEVKTLYNNGLFRQPLDVSPTTKSELVLNVDFNNPFDDGGVLKSKDLSPSNHTIIANGWGTDLNLLKASQVEINSLR